MRTWHCAAKYRHGELQFTRHGPWLSSSSCRTTSCVNSSSMDLCNPYGAWNGSLGDTERFRRRDVFVPVPDATCACACACVPRTLSAAPSSARPMWASSSPAPAGVSDTLAYVSACRRRACIESGSSLEARVAASAASKASPRVPTGVSPLTLGLSGKAPQRNGVVRSCSARSY